VTLANHANQAQLIA
jgi:hypothetical protein